MNRESLKGRRIILGVTGGIAAYKAVEVLRVLKEAGASVTVVMTRTAQEFVGRATFETLSENRVESDLFPREGRIMDTVHISLADWADLLLIAPATANIIGKVAGGIADDLLSCVVMATAAPVVFAPAMETNMLINPIVQGNIQKLEDLGYRFIQTGEGFLASGKMGKGRLAEVDIIVDTVAQALQKSEELVGKKVLVTAGRTEEDIDPVRFITNKSTGKMGYALAKRALERGADVCLISGPSSLTPPLGARVESIRSVRQMKNKVEAEFESSDVVLMASAVSDFRPKVRSKEKLKKDKGNMTLELEQTEDIAKSLGKKKGKRILVGFSMETEDEVERTKRKLEDKNWDIAVANNVLVEGAGFGTDTNVVTIISTDGSVESLPKMSKLNVAEVVLDRVVKLLNK